MRGKTEDGLPPGREHGNGLSRGTALRLGGSEKQT